MRTSSTRALLAMGRSETPDFYDAPADDEEVLKGVKRMMTTAGQNPS